MKHSDAKEHYHNKGEEDYADKEGYNPPHNVLGGLFNSREQTELNKSYDTGWANAREQDKK